MAVEDTVEFFRSLIFVFHTSGGNFFDYKRMAANGPLTKYHQAAGQNVCTLHCDTDGHRIVSAGHKVAGAGNDTTACDYVHGVVDHYPHQISIAILQKCRGHGWPNAPV